MTIIQLFKSVNKNDVLNALYNLKIDNNELYNTESKKENKEYYGNLYDSLINNFKNKIEDSTSNDKYIIVLKEKNNKELYYSSFYISLKELKEQKKILNNQNIELYECKEIVSRYGLVFTDWKDLLSMNICQKTLDNYPVEEILSHIFWEMTFFGTENDMNDKKNNLIDSIKELENSKQKYYTTEEVFDNIYNKFGLKRKERTKEEILLEEERIRTEFKENLVKQNTYILSILE